MRHREDPYDIVCKVILVGDQNSGKSSILSQMVENTFDQTYKPTIGVDFKIKVIDVGTTKVKLQMWDTAGQERFKTITLSYYRGAHGVFIVFDRTRKQSLESLKQRVRQIRQIIDTNCPIIILGNKSDNIQNIQITNQQINSYAQQNNFQYFETSAKTNINIVHAFQQVCRKMVLNHQLQQMRNIVSRNLSLPLERQINEQFAVQDKKRNWFHNVAPAALLVLFIIVSLFSQI